jgi:hypothetical protein
MPSGVRNAVSLMLSSHTGMLQHAFAPLQEVLAMSQLFDFVQRQSCGASIRFDAFVDESVDTHTEIMIRIVFGWLVLEITWAQSRASRCYVG